MSPLLAPAHARQPYPGLRPFLLEEADIFFGREEQVRQILERLNRGRFLALVGTSGCGKSSLARAGLTAALEAGFMVKAGARWRVATMRPGTQPLSNLADALLEPGVLGADVPPADALPPPGAADHEVKPFLLATLRRGPRGLAEFLSEPLTAGAGPALPEGENLLLLVDQFEELFRFWREGDRNEADAFVALLLESARQEKLPVYVVLTMRSDYLGDCAIFNGLPEALNDSQLLTPRLTRQQRRKTIEGPARVFGGQVEPALVGRLLNDMGPEPDQLPLMQHVLMRLWSRACHSPLAGPDTVGGEVILRLEEYEKLGKLTEALDQHAEEVYEKELRPEQRPIAEVLFRCLSERDVSSGSGGSRDTRRPTRLKDIAAVAGVPEEQVAAVADVFRVAGVNFLTPPPDVPLRSETVLDITHESLLRRWKRLQSWADAEAKSADIYRRLEDDARDWAAGRAGLMEKVKLNSNLEWMKREHPTAAWARRYGSEFDQARRFLEESERAEKARAAERAREKRHKRAVRIIIVGLVLAAVVLSLLLLWLSAKHAKEEAEANLRIARERAQFGVFYSLTTKGQFSMLTHPLASLLYGVEADKVAFSQWGSGSDTSLSARGLLYQALANIGGRGHGAGQGPITSIAVSEGRAGRLRWIASASQEDGTIILWDVPGNQQGAVPTRLIGYQASIRRLQFAGKTGWLIAQSSSISRNLITLWKLDDPQKVCKVVEGHQSLYMSRSGSWLLTYDYNRAKLFNLRSADPTAEPVELKPDGKTFNIRFISFCGDKWLALISGEGEVLLCDLEIAKKRHQVDAVRLKVAGTASLQAPTKPSVKNGEFTDDGSKLVVFLSDGRVRVWKSAGERWDEPGTEERLKTPFADGEEVRVVTDLRGLRAVVARKPSTAASDPSQSILTAQAGAVSTANDKSLAYLFDGNDLGRRTTLKGFDDSVDWLRYIQVDDQMGRLAVACRRPEDGIRVWDLRGSKADVPVISSNAKSPLPISSWVLASDGRWLVARGPENSVRLWNLLSRGPLQAPANLRGHDGNATVFALSEQNRWLVTGGVDGTIRTWNLTALSPSAEPYILHNAGAPHSVMVAPTNRWFAFADINIVRLWDIARRDTPFELRLPKLRRNSIPVLRASEDGRWLSATYPKGNVFESILWDTQTEGKPSDFCRLGDVQGEIARLYVSPDSEWVAATVGKDFAPSAQVWHLPATKRAGQGGKVAQPVSWGTKGYVWGFAATGKALLTNTNGSFQLWKLEVPIQEIPLREQKVFQTTQLTPDGNHLIMQTEPGQGKLIDLSAKVSGKNSPIKKLLSWPERVYTTTFISANSRWLFAVLQNKTFSCWDLWSPRSDIKPIEYKMVHGTDAEDERFQPSGTASPDQKMFVPSPDRRWLVTNEDGVYRLWDLASEQRKAQDISGELAKPRRWPLPKPKSMQLFKAVFSPDSSWLLTAETDCIQLYALKTPVKGDNPVKEPRFRLRGNPYQKEQIRAIAVSREEHWLAVNGQDSNIRVWDLTRGPEAQPLVLTSRVASNHAVLFISPGAKRIFSVDESRWTIQISRVAREELLKVAERVVGRNPSREEWKKLEMPEPYRRIFSFPEPQQDPNLDAPGQVQETGSAVTELSLRSGTAQVRDRLTKADQDDSQRKTPSKVYTIQMQQGRVYQIDLRSQAFDAFLRLEAADHEELLRDDDGGGGLNARIVFPCLKDGTYRIIATRFEAAGGFGEFTLTVQSR
jgi:WD40 repeat protein